MNTKIIKVGAVDEQPKKLKPIELIFFADKKKVEEWLNPRAFSEIYVMPKKEHINGKDYDVFFCVGLRNIESARNNGIIYGHLNDGVI